MPDYKRFKYLRSEGHNGRPGSVATLECRQCGNNLFNELPMAKDCYWYVCKVCGAVWSFDRQLEESKNV